MAAERPPEAARAGDAVQRQAHSVSSLFAWLTLAGATLALLWPIGLTNRVLAGIDALTYFTPYWDYRMAALRAGHVPLWNPYLFLGVPFLANPQAAVLYPLHWPLSWMDAPAALIWSALMHVWLAAGFTYTFARRSLGLGLPAAWLAAILFGLGGFTLARVENINQLNALAWLPALLWLYDETAAALRTRVSVPRAVRWGILLALAIALQFLAGHTQTTFINFVALGLYAVYPTLADLWQHRRRLRMPVERGANAALAASLLPLLAVLPGLLLAAAQLLPSLELNSHGLRTGGLPYRQAASFSLRPQLLAQSLLPPFGGKLAEAFASEGYAEFVAYMAVTGLILAAFGVAATLSAPASAQTGYRARKSALLLAATGIFLALGAYNPVYYVLWRFVPAFDLFRAPARWMALAALGLACLAGVGFEGWVSGLRAMHGRPSLLAWMRRVQTMNRYCKVLLLLALLAGLVLAVLQIWPAPAVLLAWALCAVVAAFLLCSGWRWHRYAPVALVALVLAELWIASRSLPYVIDATAPAALGLRSAPAALLAATTPAPAAGRDRFLSLSDIRFDPGDLAELRALQADRLPPDTVERFVRAVKQVEVIAPNLSLLLRLPALDGYDGGLLPLKDYGQLQTLFLAPNQASPDGRLREQLHEIPPDRLLDLTGVRYVITDKQNDLWLNDVYYDLEQAVLLQAGQELQLDLSDYPAFSVTALGLVSHLTDAYDGSDTGQVALVKITDTDGNSHELALLAPAHTSWAQDPEPRAAVARAWPGWMERQGRDYLAHLNLGQPVTARAVAVRVLPTSPSPLVLRGLSLIDTRTGAHTAVTLSARGDYRRVHSGDVKVYERRSAPGRAWIVHGVRPVAGETEMIEILRSADFDPQTEAVVAGTLPAQPARTAGPEERVTVITYEAERVVLTASLSAPGLLVVADTWYPGWQVSVDGQSVPLLQTNLLFRGVQLGPGEHQVVMTYRPASWRLGVWISLFAGAVLGVLFLAATILPKIPRRLLSDVV